MQDDLDLQGAADGRLRLGSHIGNVRIEAFLGQGGMGEVYRGFHEFLERPVAIKAIRVGQTLDATARTRFLREARLLSRLDHPGICRVYDLIPVGDRLFLVLELIEGRTLTEALASEDLDEEAKLDIAERIAEALVAAHRASIVHRDIKPSNVMLTREGQVKVLDFGLARAVDDPYAPRDPSLGFEETVEMPAAGLDKTATQAFGDVYTSLGSTVGTIEYMSPEQALGEPVTEASDLYSFGILLRRLFTGAGAYAVAKTPVLLLQAVAQAQTLPLGDDVAPPWRQLLGALTSLSPSDRPSAADALARMRSIRQAPARQRSRRLRAVGVGMLLGLVLATAWLTRSLVRPRPLVRPATTARVAFLPFHNATGNLDLGWVELGLLELVAESLDESARLEIVPFRSVKRAADGLGLDLGRPTPTDLDRLGRALGTNYLVDTTVAGDDVGFLLRAVLLHDGATSDTVHFAAQELTSGGHELAYQLALRLVPDDLPAGLLDRTSQDPYLDRTFAIGVQRLSTAPRVARAYFDVCLDRAPDDLRVKAKMAGALFRLGEWDAAEAMMQEAITTGAARGDLRHSLKAEVDLAYLQMDRGDYDKAEKRLLGVLAHPLGVVTELRLDGLITLGLVQWRRGELDAAEASFLEAVALSRQARIREREGISLNNLSLIAASKGETKRAIELIQQVLEIATELRDLDSQALALMNLGVLQLNRRTPEVAEDLHRRSLAIYEQLENPEGEMMNLANLGHIASQVGEPDRAIELADRALALARQLENRGTEGQILANRGAALVKRGDFAEAGRTLEQALAIGRELDDAEILGPTWTYLAYLRTLEGNLDEAGSWLEKALAWRHEESVLWTAARYAYARRDYTEALRLAEEASQAGQALSDDVTAAFVRALREAERTGHPVAIPAWHPV